MNKSSHAEGTKEENLEEITDFSANSLFVHFNSENYTPNHQVNALTLMERLPRLPPPLMQGRSGLTSACEYRTGWHH